ncbi:MAG: hypothetical protein AAGA56_27085 [Myxococcota bacterium]
MDVPLANAADDPRPATGPGPGDEPVGGNIGEGDSCATTTCPGNRVCDESSGSPECICAPGYEGTECTSCAENFQGNDGNGTCEPACIPSSCNLAGMCSDVTGSLVCDCDPGYAGEECETCAAGYGRDDEETCQWEGAITNGTFDVDTGWNLGPTSTISNGRAQLTFADLCAGGGISQALTLPAEGRGRPLILRFFARTTPSDPRYDGSIEPPMAVMFDGKVQRFEGLTSSFSEQSVCVPASATGAVLFELRSVEPIADFCEYFGIELDDIRLEEAASGECDTSSTITNGSFDDATGTGWSTTGGSVDYRDGDAVLTITNCGSTNLTQSLAIPSTPGSALSFTYSSPFNVTTGIELDGLLTRFPPSPTTTRVMCVPNYLAGEHDLRLRAFRAPAGGTCSGGSSEARFEEIRWVTDPSCVGTTLRDPGFEGFDIDGPTVTWTGSGSAEVVRDSGAAFAGEQYARLTSTSLCGGPSFIQQISLPRASASEAPAIEARYQFPSVVDTTYRAQICIGAGNEQSCTDLNPASTWTEATACVPPTWEGLPAEISLRILGPGGGCVAIQPPETLLFDEIQATTDAACSL